MKKNSSKKSRLSAQNRSSKRRKKNTVAEKKKKGIENERVRLLEVHKMEEFTKRLDIAQGNFQKSNGF